MVNYIFMVLSGPVQRYSTRRGLCTNSERPRWPVILWLNTASLLWRASSNSGDLAVSTWAESVLALQFSKLFRDIYISSETIKKSKAWLTEKACIAVTLEMREDNVRRWEKTMSWDEQMGASKTVVISQFLRLSIDTLMWHCAEGHS